MGYVRDYIILGDEKLIRDITFGSGVFNDEEIDTAKSLAVECLEKGEKISGYSFLVYIEDDVITGYACYGPVPFTVRRYDLYFIAVEKSCAGTGVGKILFKAVEDKLSHLDEYIIYAETSSRDVYLPARKFYKSCEMNEVAKLKDYYCIGDDKIVYEKRYGMISL